MKKEKSGKEYAVAGSENDEAIIQYKDDVECEVCGRKPSYLPIEDGVAGLCETHLRKSYKIVSFHATLDEARKKSSGLQNRI